MENLQVALKNTPAGANHWSMSVLTGIPGQPGAAYLSWAANAGVNINDIATFSIPSDWSLPIKIMLLQIGHLDVPTNTLTVIQEVQSWRPYLWDFDLMQYGTAPDPTYRPVFINQLGNYFYNVATKTFEFVAAPLPTPPPAGVAEAGFPIIIPLGLLAGAFLLGVVKSKKR